MHDGMACDGLVHIEDLVLRYAHVDISTPGHKLTPACRSSRDVRASANDCPNIRASLPELLETDQERASISVFSLWLPVLPRQQQATFSRYLPQREVSVGQNR